MIHESDFAATEYMNETPQCQLPPRMDENQHPVKRTGGGREIDPATTKGLKVKVVGHDKISNPRSKSTIKHNTRLAIQNLILSGSSVPEILSVCAEFLVASEDAITPVVPLPPPPPLQQQQVTPARQARSCDSAMSTCTPCSAVSSDSSVMSDALLTDTASAADPSDGHGAAQEMCVVAPQCTQIECRADVLEWCPRLRRDMVSHRMSILHACKTAPISSRFCGEDKAFVTPEVLGSKPISDAFWACVVRPLTMPSGYSSIVPTQRGFNFAISGPRGSGKFTSMKMLCSRANVDMLCVTPEAYEPYDLMIAEAFISHKRPTLLYIDGIEELWNKPEFPREFTEVILKSRMFVTEWSNAWVVLAVHDKDRCTKEVEDVLNTLCIRENLVSVGQPTGEQLAEFAIKSMMSTGLHFECTLSKQQMELLRGAAEGATAGEIHEFATRVITATMRNSSSIELMGHDRTSGDTVVVGHTLDAGSLGSDRGKHDYLRSMDCPGDGSDLELGGVTAATDLPSVSGDKKGRFGCHAKSIVITWNRDIVPLFTRIRPEDSRSGVARYVIPSNNRTKSNC